MGRSLAGSASSARIVVREVPGPQVTGGDPDDHAAVVVLGPQLVGLGADVAPSDPADRRAIRLVGDPRGRRTSIPRYGASGSATAIVTRGSRAMWRSFPSSASQATMNAPSRHSCQTGDSRIVSSIRRVASVASSGRSSRSPRSLGSARVASAESTRCGSSRRSDRSDDAPSATADRSPADRLGR